MTKGGTTRKHSGDRKHGRNKRAKNEAMSAYVRDKIDFAGYWRRINNINFDSIKIKVK